MLPDALPDALLDSLPDALPNALTDALPNALTDIVAPSVPRSPTITSINSTTLLITWLESAEPNGPSPIYSVLQSAMTFSVLSARVEEGARFPGGGYYLFPSDTIPQGVAFTGEFVYCF